MFNKLFRRNQTVPMVDLEQLDLDILRNSYADYPSLQLHFDRMQTALNRARSR
jgi:hypothetical protein